MNIAEATDILTKKSQIKDKIFTERLDKWRWLYYGMSLHTLGAAPAFNSLRTGGKIYPVNYLGEKYQYLFEEFQFSRHPSEPEVTRQWRFSQYRPLTRGPLSLLSEVVTGSVFQTGQFEIAISQEDDNAYIWGNNFHGYDIAGYFENIGYREMIDDANGVFLRIPKQSKYDLYPTKPEIDIWFVKTPNIIFLDRESFLFETDYHAFFIDKRDIWRFDKDANGVYSNIEHYYAHLLGRLPITIAGGEWSSYGYYESYYIKAKAVCDEFAATYSAAQMVDKEASHPIILEPDVECVECHGAGFSYGQVYGYTEEQKINCNKCKGKGAIHRNPMDRGLMSPKDYERGIDIKFINPDIGINKHHREVIKELQYSLMDALNLTKTEDAQSGVAKAIDQQRLFRFMDKICSRMYDVIIYDTIKDITAYRNVKTASNEEGVEPDQSIPFKIVKPQNLSIETASDILARYDEATKAQVPIFARVEMARSYIDREYGGNDVLKKKADFILYSDKLAVATMAEITGLQATPEEILYHKDLPQKLDQLIIERGGEWFVKAPIQALEDIVKQNIN